MGWIKSEEGKKRRDAFDEEYKRIMNIKVEDSCTITDEEREYIDNDILAVNEAFEKRGK